MSPFPQSFTNSSASPVMFPSSPGIIQMVIVQLCVPVSPMATLGPWIKCPESG